MRWTRIAIVTAGLVVAGGIIGTMAGTLVLGTWILALEGPRLLFRDLESVLRLALLFGGGLGAVLGPLAAWVLMRHVPLWLAVGGTTLGTLGSGGLALLVSGNPINAMLFGVFGLALSAVVLNSHVPRGDRRLTGG